MKPVFQKLKEKLGDAILEVSEEKLKELKDAGVKDYIRKPFGREDLVNRVKKALE